MSGTRFSHSPYGAAHLCGAGAEIISNPPPFRYFSTGKIFPPMPGSASAPSFYGASAYGGIFPPHMPLYLYFFHISLIFFRFSWLRHHLPIVRPVWMRLPIYGYLFSGVRSPLFHIRPAASYSPTNWKNYPAAPQYLSYL